MQRALIHYRNPKNYDLVREALTLAGREDLIGFDKKCLIKPRKLANEQKQKKDQLHREKTQQKIEKKRTIRNVHKQKRFVK